MKLKNPFRKPTRVEWLLLCGISYAVTWFVGIPNIKLFLADQLGLNYRQEHREMVEPAKAETEKEITKEEYVIKKAMENGLNPYKLWAIVQCESGWNDKAYNVNTNKTIDAGLWQINSIHYKDGFTIDDALDFKRATDWSIAKIKKEGNASAWVCNKILKLGDLN